MNISKALFFLTKLFSTILVSVKIFSSIINGYFGDREILFILSFIIFYLTTLLYQYKRKLYSVGYIFYFIVCFLSTCYGSYNYIYNKVIQMGIQASKTGIIVYSKDHFELYFSVFIIISLIIDVFLLKITPLSLESIKLNLSCNKKDAVHVLLGGLLCLPFFLLGTNFRMVTVSFVVYFFVSYFYIKKGTRNFVYYLGILCSVFFLISIIYVRYLFVQFILPLLLVSVLILSIRNTVLLTKIKTLIYTFIGFVLLFIYGITSELLKLNLNWGGSFSFDDIIKIGSNLDLLIIWGNRQVYRIIDIWARLGGNIIDYVDNNDFYYGITYIKSLSGLFGFEYVSLPSLSAKFIDANYAQPGLLAEGYANFGVVGAIINILVVFFLSELLLDHFIRKQTYFSLLLYVCCFSQVILDGGTLNSIIFMMFFCFIVWSFNIFTIKRNRFLNSRRICVG